MYMFHLIIGMNHFDTPILYSAATDEVCAFYMFMNPCETFLLVLFI